MSQKRTKATATDVAAAVIVACGGVAAVKLQKLVFLAAGEYLALTGQPMFDDPIEAWDMGPVVYTVWRQYKETEGTRSISEPAKGDPTRLNEVAQACVESVVGRFGNATGPELVKYTHEMKPWAETYEPNVYRNAIDNQKIYDYFSQSPTIEQTVEALSAWNSALSGC